MTDDGSVVVIDSGQRYKTKFINYKKQFSLDFDPCIATLT